MPAQTAQLDHLVVMATTLELGVAWCDAALGVTPGPGGEHPLMGTHNCLSSIASERFPSGVRLEALHVSHPDAPALRTALLSPGFAPTTTGVAPARVNAILQTPVGTVHLHS